MFIRRIFRSLVSRFLRAFVDNLDDVLIQWTQCGSFTVRRLSIRPLALTSWLDLQSLYIHRVGVNCSWNFLWSSAEVLKIEVDTVVGVVVPYSAKSSSNGLTIQHVFQDGLLSDWTPGPILGLLGDQLLHSPLHFREYSEQTSETAQRGWVRRMVQWGAGRVLNVASGAVSLIGGTKSMGRSGKKSGQTSGHYGASLLLKLFSLLGRVEIVVTNCHVRYEDGKSSPCHPFQMAVGFEKLHIEGSNVLVEMDDLIDTTQDQSNGLRDHSSVIEKEKSGLMSLLQISNFFTYHNTDHFSGITATDFTARSREYRRHFLRGMGRSSDSRPKHRSVFAVLLQIGIE